MHPVFQSYIDPRFRFDFTQGPSRARTRGDALATGLNCVALAHLVLEDLFGCDIPDRLRSLELYLDSEYFDHEESLTDLEPGDLLLLGERTPVVALADFVPRFEGDELANFGDFAINHVAIVTDDRADDGPVLLHASPRDTTNALCRFPASPPRSITPACTNACG